MKSDVRIEGKRLRIVRVFQALRPQVFSWCTQAEKLRQWSGCKESTHCEIVMDFRVGGSFTQTMRIAVNGGTCDFTMTGTYEEIVVPERIVYGANFGPAVTRVTVEFLEQGQATVILTYDDCPEGMFCQAVSQGAAESFEKLDALVASQVPASSR